MEYIFQRKFLITKVEISILNLERHTPIDKITFMNTKLSNIRLVIKYIFK